MTRNALLATILFAMTLATPPAARAMETCTLPSSAMWSTSTMDDVFTPAWCASFDTMVAYWNALNLTPKGKIWNEVRAINGLNDCIADAEFPRLINGAYFLDQVWYSLSNTTLPAQTAQAYQWLTAFVTPLSGPSWSLNSCKEQGPGDVAVATNYSDGPTMLWYPFFWTRTVAERASTLVHECVHEVYSHPNKGGCDGWCAKSCDLYYGDGLAQTTQIVFLGHAAMAYQREANSTELMVANFGNDVCGYVPLLSQYGRAAVTWLARDKLNSCFSSGSSFGPPSLGFTSSGDPLWADALYGWDFSADHIYGARWWCKKVCKADDYIFASGTTNLACNELYQPGNDAINAANKTLCESTNATIDEGVTPSQLKKLTSEFNLKLQKCIPGVSDAYFTQYCDGLATNAANAGAIENAWGLEDQPGFFDSEAAMVRCQRRYCQSKFNEAWIAPARQACYEWDDPSLGCMDAICGDLEELKAAHGKNSLPYFKAVQCRRHFIEHNGDTKAYFAAIEDAKGCDSVYADCVNSKVMTKWAEALANGQCILAPQAAANNQEGIYQLAAINGIAAAPSLERWQSLFPGATAEECSAAYVTCEKIRDVQAGLAADLIDESDIGYAIEKLKDGGPYPSPVDQVSDVQQAMRRLVGIAASPADAAAKLTPTQAAHQLATTPEVMHAFARQLGAQTFFAVFGTRGMAAIFGPALVGSFASADFPTFAGASASQKTAMAKLVTARATRLTIESTAFATQLGRAASSAPATLFNFMKAMQGAANLDAVNAEITKFQTAMK